MIYCLRQAGNTRWFVRMLLGFTQSVVAYVGTARHARVDPRRCIVVHAALKDIGALCTGGLRTMLTADHTWMFLSCIFLWTNAHAGTPRRQARSIIVLLYVSTRVLVPTVRRQSGLFAACRAIEAELIFIFLHAKMYCALLELLQSHALRDHVINLVHTVLRPWHSIIRSFCSLHIVLLMTYIG